MGCCDSTAYELDKDTIIFSQSNQFEIYAAILKQDMEELEDLRKKGFRINYKMPHFAYRSALHIAAQIGSKDVIVFLVQYDADVNIRDRQGITPAMIAAQNRHSECVLLLDELGADFSLKNIFGMNIKDYIRREDRKYYRNCKALEYI